MASPVLGSVNLLGVKRIDSDKNANIIPLPLPTKDSDESQVFDLLGVVKLISIDGEYSAGTIALTKAYADSIEALVNGDQNTIDFVSDQMGTISCMVNQVRIGWSFDVISKVTFSIKLIQGQNV